MLVTTYWFKHDEVWHAIKEDSHDAVCDEARIKHNLDSTATHISSIPVGQTIHPKCREIVTKAEKA